jgi:hypothetical protein
MDEIKFDVSVTSTEQDGTLMLTMVAKNEGTGDKFSETTHSYYNVDADQAEPLHNALKEFLGDHPGLNYEQYVGLVGRIVERIVDLGRNHPDHRPAKN